MAGSAHWLALSTIWLAIWQYGNMAGSGHWPVSTISDEWESGLADQQGEVGPKVEAGLNYLGSVHTRLQSLRLHFVKNTSFFFGSGQFEVNLNLLAI